MKRPLNLAARTVAGLAFGVVLATSMASTASAALLYEQAPVLDNAFPSSGDPASDALAYGNGQLADNFSLAGAALLEKVTWWGVYFDPMNPDDFRLRLYTDVSGSGNVLEQVDAGAVKRTATGTTLGGSDVYRYELNLPTAINLGAARPYYLFVENHGGPDWYWLTGDAGDSEFMGRFADSDHWQNSLTFFDPGVAADLAFRLDGAGRQSHTDAGQPGELEKIASR